MRIDEINRAAEERYGKETLFIMQDLKNAFVEGALWSDDHPDTIVFRPSSQVTDINL